VAAKAPRRRINIWAAIERDGGPGCGLTGKTRRFCRPNPPLFSAPAAQNQFMKLSLESRIIFGNDST
jgi:hypothetical protein